MANLVDKKARKLRSQGKEDTVPQVWQMMMGKGDQRELDRYNNVSLQATLVHEL